MRYKRIIGLLVLLLLSIVGYGQSLTFTKNADGTWTMDAPMPDYDIELAVEYEDVSGPVLDGITFTKNADGTWTMDASMPDYDIELVVEYEDAVEPVYEDITFTQNADGTWTMDASMPDYDIELVVEYEEVDEYNLYVGGTQVTSRNMYDILGDGKVSYDPASNTLTLNGANIQAKSGIHGYGIQAEEDNMKIKLLGYNTITTTNRNGIRIKGTPNSGPITLLGGGLLFITSSTAGFLSYNDVKLTDGVKIIVENIGTSSGGFDGMKQSTSAPFPTLTMSGTGTVLRAKGGPNGSVHNFHTLSLYNGIKIFEPEGAIFVEDEGIKKNGAMVANEWVTIGNKDFIDGVNNPNANLNLNEGMFNLAGQRVDSKYKGVVIKGGKKVLNK